MAPSIGHNGGPPINDLEVLAGIYSLTIARTSEVTGLSRSRLYRYLDAGRLRSYKVGKARLIIGQSLRELLTELAANPENAPPLPPRQGHRFAPSRAEYDTDRSAKASVGKRHRK